jgi:hypothetical protein
LTLTLDVKGEYAIHVLNALDAFDALNAFDVELFIFQNNM